MTVEIIHGDCIEAMRNMPDNSVDSIVTDPPYGLSAANPQQITDTMVKWASGERDYTPQGKGFMGKSWDAFVPPPALWDEAMRVLKPGGHLLAFAGSRTQDLMGLSIRLAGFEIRESVCWLYGSGFPKSLDVSKAIDKKRDDSADADKLAGFLRGHLPERPDWDAIDGVTGSSNSRQKFFTPSTRVFKARVPSVEQWGAIKQHLAITDDSFDAEVWRLNGRKGTPGENWDLREVVGEKTAGMGSGKTFGMLQSEGANAEAERVIPITSPATPAASEWQGWGTALKPAYEPVVCAQKPFNMVPLDVELTKLDHLLGAITWLSLSPAKRAETASTSSQAEPNAAWCVSALANAATRTSHAESAKTDTFNSPALDSTFSNIATSWNSILAALSAPTKTFTTATRSSTTTDLQTLNSLLAPIISPTTMPQCACPANGSASSATNADETSTDEWANWLRTLNASVPETAIEGIAHAAASALARVAEKLSGDQAAVNSAAQPATTAAGGKLESIVMARKPFPGTVAGNVQTWGTGALNINATRIGTTEPLTGGRYANLPDLPDGAAYGAGISKRSKGEFTQPSGRWPANVALDETTADGFEESRFFKVARVDEYGAISEHFPREFDAPFMYVAKAPKKERPVVDGVSHPTVKPLALMRWLVKLVTPPGGTVLEPFAGSGATVEACILEGFNVIAIEQEADYLPLIQARIDRAA